MSIGTLNWCNALFSRRFGASASSPSAPPAWHGPDSQHTRRFALHSTHDAQHVSSLWPRSTRCPGSLLPDTHSDAGVHPGRHDERRCRERSTRRDARRHGDERARDERTCPCHCWVLITTWLFICILKQASLSLSPPYISISLSLPLALIRSENVFIQSIKIQQAETRTKSLTRTHWEGRTRAGQYGGRAS